MIKAHLILKSHIHFYLLFIHMHAIRSHYRVIGKIVIIDISVLVCGHRGPCSKYDISIAEGDFKGELEMVWESAPLKVHICADSVCIST